MSISSEVTRITNAKAAIRTAIEGKGVTVPDGTKLDGMAALIEGIKAGGAKVGTGSFTVANDITGNNLLNIPHNLGVEPYFVAYRIVHLSGYLPVATVNKVVGCLSWKNVGIVHFCQESGKEYPISSWAAGQNYICTSGWKYYGANSTSLIIMKCSIDGTEFPVMAGDTFDWIAVGG